MCLPYRARDHRVTVPVITGSELRFSNWTRFRMAEEELKDRGFTFLNDIRLACIKLIQDGAAGTA